MVGLCEGGNEPPGSLKAIGRLAGQLIRSCVRACVGSPFGLWFLPRFSTAMGLKPDGLWLVLGINPFDLITWLGFSEVFPNQKANAGVAQITTYTVTMTAIDSSSSFVPIPLQRDVIVVHRSGEIQNTLFAKHGITVNAAAYIETLVKLRRALRDKRHNIYADDVKFLHDNARPHVAASVREKINTFGWEVLQHPPYIMAFTTLKFTGTFFFPQVVVITEDVQNVHLLLEYRPHIDVSLICEHDPKLQEYCVCPQDMPQFDFDGIPNQAPETNKPMILNCPTNRNREGSDQVSVEDKQLGHLYLSIDQETFDPSTGEVCRSAIMQEVNVLTIDQWSVF
ncbi:hypothetical protein ANN_10068 [Periplaneta americana]|uniref:Mariner Mos1 transposase n=1 Tax=Periplaneta americana TaxID=6978 RepID=A0ABQ8TPI7_PERAM|nr:hypothetical protein ANN_10068 [Periplaneta americana]